MEKAHKDCNIFKEIKENISLQVIVCIALSSIIIIGFLLLYKYLDFKESREYTIVEDINLINSIENMNINNSNFELNGYAFMLKQNSTFSSISLLLREVNNGDEVWLDVKQIKRPDINTYFDCEYNYENTGFQALAGEDELKDDECYEILINIDYRDSNGNKIRKTVSSNTYVFNSEIYNYNPCNFDQPELNIESELLRNVFSKGSLCFYQKDTGLYLYQYEGKLY